MKKFITAPALFLLVCSFAACGKTDSASPVVAASQEPVVTNPAPQPNPLPGNQPTSDFNTWCNQRGGLYYASHAVCRIQESTQYGPNLNLGMINTQIPIYMNDTVSIILSGSANAIVGGVSYPANSTFVATSQGSLFLDSGLRNSYKLKSIHLTRCYNHNYQSVRCPI